jgi:tetratricopeptide (TPR) repeat protein
MGIFDKFFKPNIEKLKENQDVEGLIKALDCKDKELRAKVIEVLKDLGTDRAKKAIEAHETRGLDRAKVLTDKGITLAQQCRFEEALKCFEGALEHDSQCASTWYWKSMMLQVVTGDFKAALEAVEIALQLDPKLIAALEHKARLLGPSQYSEQLDCYDKILEVDPLYADGWKGKAGALAGMRRYDEAVLCCKKAAELAPLDAMVWHEVGSILEEAGCIDEAIPAYERFVELATEQSSTLSETRSEGMVDETKRALVSLVQGKISKYEHEVRSKEPPKNK